MRFEKKSFKFFFININLNPFDWFVANFKKVKIKFKRDLYRKKVKELIKEGISQKNLYQTVKISCVTDYFT